MLCIEIAQYRSTERVEFRKKTGKNQRSRILPVFVYLATLDRVFLRGIFEANQRELYSIGK
jgi:hypothetical protein